MAENNGNGNPVAVGSGLNQQNVPQQQQAVQGNNDAAQLARQIQANTNVTMKTEVVKLPDFYGEPGKDTDHGTGIHGPHQWVFSHQRVEWHYDFFILLASYPWSSWQMAQFNHPPSTTDGCPESLDPH